MWLSEWCYLCLVSSRVGDLIRCGKPKDVGRLLNVLSRLVYCESRTEAFVESFKTVMEIVDEDPYRGLKAKLADIGRGLALRLREELASRGWDLKAALRYSAAANIIDTSVLGYEPVEIERVIYDEPAIEELVDLDRVRKVAIALDNAGEAQVDLVLAEALSRRGFEVKLVVRGLPYEIDVTPHDLRTDFELVALPDSYPAFKHELPPVDLVIAKGIANLEAYLEWGGPPTLHLLRAKCDVLAKAFNVPKNSTLILSGEAARNILLGRVGARREAG